MKSLMIPSLICFNLIVVALSHHHYHMVPHYYYEYGVHDPHTHDFKSQYEHRDHDHVHGGYRLKEPDGTYRIVEYISGPHTGFKAIVHRVGDGHDPEDFFGIFHW